MLPIYRILVTIPIMSLANVAWGSESGLIEPNLRFTHLSISDGMVAGEVRAILQDKEGTVWIGTERGLCRYDGYEVKIYRNLQSQSDSLRSNSVTSLVEDHSGAIWVGTEEGFLDRLSPQTGTFEHRSLFVDETSVSQLDGIRCLLLDRSRNLWIGTGDGVVRMDSTQAEGKPYRPDPGNAWLCNTLMEAADGMIWCATESGEVLCHDPVADEFRVVRRLGSRVHQLAQDPSGRILMTVEGKGLLAFAAEDTRGETALEILDSNPGISSVNCSPSGEVWTGSLRGLGRLHPKSRKWSRFERDPLDEGSLMDSRVSCLFADRRGVLWVGFSSGGASRFLLDHPWFSKLVIAESGRPGLSGRSISSLLHDNRGRVWVGTSGGLDLWDAPSGTMTHAMPTSHLEGSVAKGDVTAILETRRGEIWAGTRDGDLFQPALPLEPDEPPLIDGSGIGKVSGMITALVEDDAGRLWIGSRGSGITVVTEDRQSREQFSAGGEEGLGDRFINDLCVDRKGTVWVGTASQGLLWFDTSVRRFEPHPHLGNGEVLDLFLDSEGSLWVANSGRGLTRLNLQTGEIFTINRRNSSNNNPLPDDTVRAITEDASGYLWVSTDEGLARMDRATFEFRTFDEHDGLQARMFHSRVAARDRSGRLLFGGPNGLNVIDPNRLPEPRRAERPILTGLELFGEPVLPSPGGILERPLALTARITIPQARHSRIAFRFSTLDYTTPRRSLFRYRLEGADTDWQVADDRRRAAYAGLPAGSYRFVVESSADGLKWNADNASVALEIRPPWHGLWYTRAALGVIAVMLLIYLLLHRTRMREEMLRRQQEQLEVRYSKAEAALARQLQHAMLLEQTGLALGSDEGTKDLLGNALRQFGEAFGVVRSYVLAGFLAPDGRVGGHFHLVAEYRDASVPQDGDDVDLTGHGGFVSTVLRTDRALAVSDIATRPDLFPGMKGLSESGTRAILAVRTSYLGQPNGYLVLQHGGSSREWQSDEIKLLESLAGQFGMVLAQIAQQERDERQRRELEKAKQDADLANRSKSDFLAKMTHELRTPLNAIIGFSELLSGDIDLTRRQRETLDIINHSGEHLLGVINDILEISKIEAGKVELRNERFNLSNLLTSVYEMLAFGARSKGISFAIDKVGELPGDIIADKGKLRQVLVNLVGNATKFTEKGGITVVVRATPLIPGSHRRLVGFEIRDTGPGISANELPRLFEKFHQTESGQKVRRGTGLGLAISKAFVEMMEGRIEVASTVGVGTVFRFTIVCEDAGGAATSAAGSGVGSVGPGEPMAEGHRPRRLSAGHPEIRILIAEDQPANRLLATRILRSAGFAVREAENGAEAVELWRDFHPHLILMDEEMPVMRGREATRLIREQTEGRGPIIVSLTAFALDETRIAALAAGSDDFLAKPFRIDDLLGTIARHLPVEYERSADAA